jgi:hypothetical protein
MIRPPPEATWHALCGPNLSHNTISLPYLNVAAVHQRLGLLNGVVIIVAGDVARRPDDAAALIDLDNAVIWHDMNAPRTG